MGDGGDGGGGVVPPSLQEKLRSHYRQQFWHKAFWDSLWVEVGTRLGPWGGGGARLVAGPPQLGGQVSLLSPPNPPSSQTVVFLQIGSSSLLEALPGVYRGRSLPPACIFGQDLC